LPKQYLEAINHAVDKVLEATAQGNFTADFMEVTAKELTNVVKKNYQSIAIDWKAPDMAMLHQLTQDVWQFAAAKNYQQLHDLTQLLRDEKGNLRDFADFKQKALKIVDKYNRSWMHTEYNLAIAASQNAARWTDFQGDKEAIPNLKYQTVGDSAVRASHQILDGVIKSIDDAFWKTNYPPNGYGCRCEVVQTLDNEVTPKEQTPYVPVPKLFQTNLANSGLIFPKGHPYYESIPEHVLVKSLKHLPLESAFLVEEYKNKKILTHVKHHTHELPNNMKITKTLIDNYKAIDKIELLPDISGKELELKKRFYPKHWHPFLGAKNADSIIYINGQATVVEFKYLVGNGKRIQNEIYDASKKSEFAVIMLTEKSVLQPWWVTDHLGKWFIKNTQKQFKGVLVVDHTGKEV